MSVISRSSLILLPALVALTGPAPAQPGWGSSWGRSGWDRPDRLGWRDTRTTGTADREGRVDTDSFVAQDAQGALGHGVIAVTAAPGSAADARDQAAYEAAVVDQLVKAGYDTTAPDPQDGQIAEVRIVRDVLLPEEAPHRPVSGTGTIGVSNRGTMMGMGIYVDLSKPKKALVSTRLEARVRDRASNRVLWEGRAEMATREGDDRWNQQAIATRLAAALFKDFPEGSEIVRD